MKKLRKTSWILCLALLSLPLFVSSKGVTKRTVEYAKREKQTLMMDIYSTENCTGERKPCLLFVFGGGFYEGARDAQIQLDYYDFMAKRGFVVAAIDYRLGLKDVKDPQKPEVTELAHAIGMAVEDLFEATGFVLKNADELNINKSKIVLSGSSAGGITVQTAHHKSCNEQIAVLPESFNYAGVITFSGAIFSPEKTPQYSLKAPAPTLMFHGEYDKIVPYGGIEFMNGGMFGSKAIADALRANNYPYCLYTVEGFGHSVSVYPMSKYLREIELFTKEFLFEGKKRFINISIKDNDQPLDPNLDF